MCKLFILKTFIDNKKNNEKHFPMNWIVVHVVDEWWKISFISCKLFVLCILKSTFFWTSETLKMRFLCSNYWLHAYNATLQHDLPNSMKKITSLMFCYERKKKIHFQKFLSLKFLFRIKIKLKKNIFCQKKTVSFGKKWNKKNKQLKKTL